MKSELTERCESLVDCAEDVSMTTKVLCLLHNCIELSEAIDVLGDAVAKLQESERGK